MSVLEDSQEIIDVFELSAQIGKEFGETIAIVKAAEMLGLVDTPKDDVLMTQLGWYFLAAPLPARKTLFKQTIMKLRLFQIVSTHLDESADGTIDGDVLREELASLLPYDQPSRLFETLVAWGRYAEILDYDETANAITRQQSDAGSGDDAGTVTSGP